MLGMEMSRAEFLRLSADLRTLAARMPLGWGHVQNNAADDKIDMFAIDSYEQLERRIACLDNDARRYLRRRWYLWQCSRCDEYLFYKNPNVTKNPNGRDKEYDIEINGVLRFDVKGTVIPRQMRGRAEDVIRQPQEMIEFFYNKQSQGRRYDIQNRLFVVHHSFVDAGRELYLRCAWQSKELIYSNFCNNVDEARLYDTHGVKAGVIFVLEREKNVVCSPNIIRF